MIDKHDSFYVAGIDAQVAAHQIIELWIYRPEIFRDDQDRYAFLWFGPDAFIEYKYIKGVPLNSRFNWK